MLTSRPELLKFNIDESLIISHLIPTMNNSNMRLWDYERQYPLPEYLNKAISYRLTVLSVDDKGITKRHKWLAKSQYN